MIVLMNKPSALLLAALLLIPLMASAEGVVCLYKNPNFQGDHICHDGDVMNFANIHLNDAVSSVKLYGEARVRFYEHAGLGGRSVLVQDDVERLGPRLDDQFSSMQFVSADRRDYQYWDDDETRGRPETAAGYWRRRGQDDLGAPYSQSWQRRRGADRGVAGVCVYEHWDFKGWERCFAEGHPNFRELGIDNLVSSIKVVGNVKAQLFEHKGFQGYKRVFTKSDPRLNHRDNDAYSSIVVTR